VRASGCRRACEARRRRRQGRRPRRRARVNAVREAQAARPRGGCGRRPAGEPAAAEEEDVEGRLLLVLVLLVLVLVITLASLVPALASAVPATLAARAGPLRRERDEGE